MRAVMNYYPTHSFNPIVSCLTNMLKFHVSRTYISTISGTTSNKIVEIFGKLVARWQSEEV